MANEFKIKKGLIVTGASGGTVVDIQGSQGQLFSVTDNLSGSIFAVSDISGVPILDVNSSGVSYFDGTVGIGTSSPGKKLEVKSDITYDGIQISGSSIPTLAIIDTTNNAKLVAYARDSDATIGTETNHALTINTNNTTALTLANNQNANFAGDVTVSGGDLNVGNSSTVNSVINMLGTNDSFIEKDTGNHLYFANNVGDKDIKFRIKDDTTNVIALTIDGSEGGDATFVAQAFSAATSSGDASSTLTTKGYVDGLITGATIYRGAWQAGISATSSAATTASTTLTVTAAILDADGNTPVLVGAVVTGEGITGIVKVASVTSSTVYVLDTAITATATAYIFSPIYGAPDLSGVTETSGYYYICSEAGSATPNGANSEPNTWAVGDWCIYNDVSGTGQWQKIDNSSVLSGAGTGQTVALWEGPSSVTDSETLGNAPITVSGSDTTFAQDITARIGSFKSPDATSSILMNLMANDGVNAATFRTTSTGKIFEIQSQNSGTLKFTSPISWYTGQIGIGTNGPVADLQVLSTKDGMTNGLNTNQLKLSYGGSVVGAGSSVAFGVSGNLNFTGAKIVHERTASNSVGDLTFWTRQTVGTSTDYDLTIERMRIKSDGNIQLNAYGAGTLVTDASGNITTSSGGGAGGPYLPLSAGSSYPLTGDLYIEGADKALRINNGTQPVVYLGDGGANTDGQLILYNSSGDVNVVLNGDNQNHYITNGNVGIGTTSPGYKLEVDTNGVHDGIKIRGANAPGLTLQDDSSNSTSSILIQSTAAAQGNLRISADENNAASGATIEFKVSGDDKMRILANGNVGINNTGPTAKLHVLGTSTGDATTKAEMLSNSVFSVRPHATNSGTLAIAQVDSGNSVGMQFTNGPGTSDWDISLQPFGGNIGIGLTNPAVPLHVDGWARLNGSLQLDGSNRQIMAIDNTSLLLGTNNTERMRITSAGNVGIGTTYAWKLS